MATQTTTVFLILCRHKPEENLRKAWLHYGFHKGSSIIQGLDHFGRQRPLFQFGPILLSPVGITGTSNQATSLFRV